MKNISKLLSIALLSALSLNIKAQTADEIIKKHIEAIGGKENWSKIKSIRMEGIMKAQGAEIQITQTQIDKKAARTDISVMGMNGYSIITDKEGWSFMPFQGQTKPEPMTADDIKSSQDELLIQDEFMTYKELGKKAEYLGKDDVDGTDCHKLKMTDKAGKETTFYIDPSNYYVVKETQKVNANGKEMENSTTYGNYKKINEGIVYPMSFASGWGETEVVKLEINPVIDEAIFKPTM